MKNIILLLCFLISSFTLFAQAPDLQKTDLRQVHIDQLRADDIQYYYNKMQQSGFSLDQAIQVLAAKGLPQDEIAKLQQRIQTIKNNPKVNAPTTPGLPGDKKLPNDSMTADARTQEKLKPLVKEEEVDKRIFGAELFSTSSLTFEPNLSIASPSNYVLGPGDQLVV